MDRPGKRERVRKRTANACTRCRRQKIRCSGREPCEQCSRRKVRCAFDNKQLKVYVSRSYIDQLERRAACRQADTGYVGATHHSHTESPGDGAEILGATATPQPPETADGDETDAEAESMSEESHSTALRTSPDPAIRNPLDPSSSDSFTVNSGSKRYFLGVSSNWSYGQRVLRMVHEKTHGTPLSSAGLLFEGSTYDLGWDGQRSLTSIDTTSLPTSDLALFLINAVRFRCGGLFHMLDEATFMQHFHAFYGKQASEDGCNKLWLIHFQLLLAFGKAFTIRSAKGTRPPGAELFVQAMQTLPDIIYLQNDPLQSIEILCCAALYLHCLDLRCAGYNLIGQAMRMATEQGMHTNMQSHHLSEGVVERCREIWWTVVVLDRHMSSLMGVPIGFFDDDITAPLPSFGGSTEKSLALGLHVKLSRAQMVIVQTVYGRSGGRSERFISSMKDALKTLAEADQIRNESFPIDLKKPTNAISRIAAYLHLFHYQALILATRPLLFSFLQKRLESSKILRISSTHGARALIRVCVNSALQCLSILEILQVQNLLETFIPFDLDATYSSALILTITEAVDPSFVRSRTSKIETAHLILDEMVSQGNLIAKQHKRELEQLRANLAMLKGIPSEDYTVQQPQLQDDVAGDVNDLERLHSAQSTHSSHETVGFMDLEEILNEWNSEDGLNGEQLLEVANNFDFEQLVWPESTDFENSLDFNNM